MSMQNTKLINQKEYLKKYLSGDKEKKKKKKDKKHKKSGQAKVKIIDDDAYDENREEMDEDLLLGGEDAPQIVGEYIEENANAIRSKWRNIAVKDEPKTETEEISLRIKEEPKEEEEELWGRKSHTAQIKQECEKELSKSSPIAIRIKQEKRSSSRERSPVQSKRKNSSDQNSPRRKQKRDSDHSPVRKRRNSDQSPPRKRQNSDQSPPRRQRSNNISPPRRYRDKDSFHQSPPEKRNRSALKRRDSDQSPARKRPDADQSLSRRGSDQSPPRRRPAASTDQSPPRRKADFPPKITKREERRTSPPQRERKSRWARTEGSRTPSPPPTHKPKAQSARTLDGKKAGLQDAQSLKTESDIRRREEQRMFEQMSSDVSGRNAEVQMRSTGRRGRRAREAAEEDPVEQQRKAAHEEKKKELYNRWGKGLKQLEDQQARHAEMAHEASKPVARYANDEDLDRHLREQEHADDPMLEYMRQKRKKREEQSDKPVMPVYEGSYPENRYGIRPGYRWDGVDRSNGYEQRWFDKQNERRAVQDEAYKYSVEDM